jgi:hypothetical protein
MQLDTATAFARHSRRALCAGFFLTIASTAAPAADERCGQLEALNQQYIGVSLTTEQKLIKRKLVAWYNSNCRSTKRASNGD